MALSRDAITRLLIAHREGDDEAFRQLTELVYGDLRRIALGQIARGGAGETLNATALVHEAYLRLIDERQVEWQGRAHFFAIAARSMRRIIVDHARERGAQKRGGGQPHLELDPERIAVVEQAETLLALDRALAAMSEIDERLARVAECRLFGGLSEEETAQALAVSLRTEQRDWQRARAWLQREMPR
jgi:RNA polymerase sigma factor (TIGR02999 family)